MRASLPFERRRFFHSVIVTGAFGAVLFAAPLPAAAQAAGGGAAQAAGGGAQAARTRAGCPTDDIAPFHRCALEKTKTYNPARTPDGKPDLQGIWRRSIMNIALEAFPGDEFARAQKTLIVDPVDGTIPYQPWAAAQKKEHFDKYVDANALCFVSGVPRMLYISPINQVIQTAGYIVIAGEEAHVTRIIPMDGRPHVGEGIRLWMGNSRGRWDGNTLVIDVTNQNGKPWLDVTGDFTSHAVHVVERLALIDADTLLYEATVEDPNVFTRPWKTATFLTRETQPGFEMLEEACHEGERFGQSQLLHGTRTLFPGVTGKNIR